MKSFVRRVRQRNHTLTRQPFNSANVSCDTRVVDESALEKHGNRWVAVQDDGTIVADANDLDTLLIALQNLPDTKASIQRVPAADEPLFVGLR